ncbi:MAG: zinc ABC transporter substrate-binding protein, partial [Treponema sp.]|nr:zinc ABC transporter substrate-binding protein [Treponema sp.]
EYDEHVWLSLRHAQVLCTAIADALCAVDSAHASLYKNNVAAYNAQLAQLDAEYTAMVNSARTKTVLFGDRFPFRYLVDDYGLSYHAAFSGCSAETEASFKTIVFLANKVDELGLQSVLTIEMSDKKIARTIIQNSRAKRVAIRTLDSMQATTARDIKRGATYLGIMRKNLDVLREVLN